MADSGACGTGAAARVQDIEPGSPISAWRERGAHRFDPVRFCFIEALARRAAAHRGEARRLLDDRVEQLLAAYGQDLQSAGCAGGGFAKEDPPPHGPLAGLLVHIAACAPAPANGAAASKASRGPADTPELEALAYFRRTWARLSADQRLTQSLAKVPENAGPLHSQQLVHRSLTLMRELSPEYLDRFMTYVDALLWLDQAKGGRA